MKSRRKTKADGANREPRGPAPEREAEEEWEEEDHLVVHLDLV